MALGGPARLLQGRALRAVAAQRLQLVTGQQHAVRADDTPPGNGSPVEGHDAPDLTRPALLKPLGNVPVRHHVPRRDEIRHVKDPLRVLRQGVRRKTLLAHPPHPAAPHRQSDGLVPRSGTALGANFARPHCTLMPTCVGGACHHRAGGDW